MKIKVNQGWNKIEFETESMNEAVAIIESLSPACKQETTFEIVVAEDMPEPEEGDENAD